jgi:hypothetical protein
MLGDESYTCLCRWDCGEAPDLQAEADKWLDHLAEQFEAEP